MPWNFPLWQVIRFAAPANHGWQRRTAQACAQRSSDCAVPARRVPLRAGLPEGVFTNLFVETEDRRGHHRRSPGRRGHPDRQRASRVSGRRHSGERAPSGACSSWVVRTRSSSWSRPISTPRLQTAVTSRLISNGQSCIAAKRFIVVDAIADEFIGRFIDAMDGLIVGDPLDPATRMRTHRHRDPARPADTTEVEDARSQGLTVHVRDVVFSMDPVGI